MPADRRYPLGGEMSDVVLGIVRRLRVTALQERYSSVAVLGVLAEGVTGARVAAAALSLGATAGFMAWLGVPHPPAGATTLIVSLGILATPAELATLMLAVVAIVLQGRVINRLAGVAHPLWRSPR